LVASGLGLKKNRNCIKFFEVDEKNIKKQLAGQIKLKKEVTDLKSFNGVSIQAVLNISVHPISFLQLKDPFKLYLHDMRSSDDLAVALHTYTRRYKYCYVDKIAALDPTEQQQQQPSTTDAENKDPSLKPNTPPPKKQYDIKKQTILHYVDEDLPIPMVVRTTTQGKIYRAMHFGLSFLIVLLCYLLVL